jgi:biotin carboxyl carrier protein
VTYDVEIAGRTRRVAVRREGDGFAISVDGRSWHVDARRSGPHTLSLIVDSTTPSPAGRLDSRVRMPSGVSVEVTLVPAPAGQGMLVQVGPVPVLVGLNGRHRAATGHDRDADGGPQQITTPMPGKIVRVLVKRGDAVSPRQPLVVVEAMKMENELRAQRGGTVTEVHGREGVSVEAGTLLVVIQ